jgi:hypothetical protein
VNCTVMNLVLLLSVAIVGVRCVGAFGWLGGNANPINAWTRSSELASTNRRHLGPSGTLQPSNGLIACSYQHSQSKGEKFCLWASDGNNDRKIDGRVDDVGSDIYREERDSLSASGSVEKFSNSHGWFNFSVDAAEGSQWISDVLAHLPIDFIDRYGPGNIPDKLYVRRSYKELYDEATRLLAQDPQPPSAVQLITGVPGIGKSVCIIYFIYRYLRDSRFANKRLAVEFSRDEYCYFLPSAEGASTDMYKITTKDLLPFRDIVIISDFHDQTQPKVAAKFHYIFSSPDPSRFKEFMKRFFEKRRFTMPTWSFEELKYVNKAEKQWMTSYELFGGVPRLVFNSYEYNKGQLNLAIEAKGRDMIERMCQKGWLGGNDEDTDYLLLHIEPLYNESSGKYDYSGVTAHLASAEVERRLFEEFTTGQANSLLAFFSSNGAQRSIASCGPTGACKLYEALVHKVFPFDGRNISLQPLRDKRSPYRQTQNETMQVPSDIAVLSTSLEKTLLKPFVYYIPAKRDLESVYSFCIDKDRDGNYVLKLFQITVGESHSVNEKGIRDIYSAIRPDIRNQLTAIFLVFVTPVQNSMDLRETVSSEKVAVEERDDKVPGEAAEKKRRVVTKVGKVGKVGPRGSLKELLSNMKQYRYEHKPSPK